MTGTVVCCDSGRRIICHFEEKKTPHTHTYIYIYIYIRVRALSFLCSTQNTHLRTSAYVSHPCKRWKSTQKSWNAATRATHILCIHNFLNHFYWAECGVQSNLHTRKRTHRNKTIRNNTVLNGTWCGTTVMSNKTTFCRHLFSPAQNLPLLILVLHGAGTTSCTWCGTSRTAFLKPLLPNIEPWFPATASTPCSHADKKPLATSANKYSTNTYPNCSEN